MTIRPWPLFKNSMFGLLPQYYPYIAYSCEVAIVLIQTYVVYDS